MAKKKTKKKVSVKKKTNKKKMGKDFWFKWIIITGFLAIMTGLIYGAVNLYVDSPIMIFGVIK